MLFKLSKLTLCLATLFVAIVSVSTLFPFIVGKYVWFRSAVDVAGILFLLGLALEEDAGVYVNRIRQIFKNPIVIATTLFVAMFLLACAFGVNPANSFWSNFERGEGGFQMIHLYGFFILLATLFREKKDWDWFMKWMLVAAVLMILYGVAAGLKYIDAVQTPQLGLTGQGGTWYQTFSGFVGPSFKDPAFRFQGSIGNPAYVAGYLIFSLFSALYLFVSTYKSKILSWGGATMCMLMLFFLIFFFLAATRGAFIGLGAGILVAFLYMALSRPAWRKRLFVIFGLLMVAAGILILFQNNPLVKAIPGSRIFTISFYADTFATRRIIWSMAWHGFLARPILGFGPENFLVVFSRFFDTRYFIPTQGFGAWFDRAHSVVFDYLVETGILGFLSYLAMLGSVFFMLRAKTRAYYEASRGPIEHEPLSAKALIVALPVAYLVQGLILFDVLSIYVSLFFFMAFVVFQTTSLERTIHSS